MRDEDTKATPVKLADWLKAEVTLALPRWALLAAGAGAFVLLLAALD